MRKGNVVSHLNSLLFMSIADEDESEEEDDDEIDIFKIDSLR